jgi:NDP-sugar pyrophosphorylase family protein
MNIVVLMAGDNELFKDSAYNFPKPLIEIDNKPMVQHVVENIMPLIEHGDKVIFVTRKEDSEKYYLTNTLQLLVPDAVVVPVSGNTSGAAVTALLAIEEMNEEKSLLIINGDQIIEKNLLELVNKMKDVDAGVVVFRSVHPRWSFVRCDEDGYVVESAEKRPISNLATAGFYYYKKAGSFIEAAKRMILKGSHVNNAYYVCPVFNEMILDNKKIIVTKIEDKEYHSLSTPKMVSKYEEYLINKC